MAFCFGYAIVIYAELSGDFPLGDSRQPTYKSLRPF
ncbi:short-chain dehydrogenase, partial [Acinetobacter pittii]